MRDTFAKAEAAQKRGGLGGKIAHSLQMARAGLIFARLYMIPVKKNEIPATSRLQPSY